jgi:hypothetical protein
MRQPENDVRLSDGEAFMVASGPYDEHLQVATDIREVSFYEVMTCFHLNVLNVIHMLKSLGNITGPCKRS